MADDYSMFLTTTGLEEGFSFSVDMIFNNKFENKRLSIAVHYISNAKVKIAECVVISDIDLQNSTHSIIRFNDEYFNLAVTEEDLQSNHHTLVFTILSIEADGEDFSVEPVGFTFIPLQKLNGSFMQGIYQLPVYLDKLNTFIYEILEDLNPWILIGEISSQFEKIGTMKPSEMSILVRIKLSEYDGWLERNDSLQLINTMFVSTHSSMMRIE